MLPEKLNIIRPQTCSGSVLESGLKDPLASITFHHCKIQPDVSIKALFSLKFPQFYQRWRVSRVSGGGESPPLPGPAVSALAGPTWDADEASANQRRGRCSQRRLLSRPVSRGKTSRAARAAYHLQKPTQWAWTWRGKVQISQENGQWSRPRTLRNFWKRWVSNASGDYLSRLSHFFEHTKCTLLVRWIACTITPEKEGRKERKKNMWAS